MKAKMKLLILASLLFLPAIAQAQFTLVTGTVTDPNGIPYVGGTISASLVTLGGTSPTLNGVSFSGLSSPVQLDSNAKFTMRLADNNVISPGGTQWKFTVNHVGVPPPFGFGPQSFSTTITITGSTQDITSNLTAVATNLTRTAAGTGLPVGGTVGQVVTNSGPGTGIWNSTINLPAGGVFGTQDTGSPSLTGATNQWNSSVALNILGTGGFDQYNTTAQQPSAGNTVSCGADTNNIAVCSENGAQPQAMSLGPNLPNDGTNATIANGTACLTPGAATLTGCPTSTTAAVQGVVVNGSGTTGTPRVVSSGPVQAQFDAVARVTGHYVIPSTTNIGYLEDSGVASSSACPTGSQVLGTYTGASATGAGIFSMILQPGLCTNPTIPAAPVTSVFSRTGAVTAAANDYTLDQLGNPAADKTFTFGSTSTNGLTLLGTTPATVSGTGSTGSQLFNITAPNGGNTSGTGTTGGSAGTLNLTGGIGGTSGGGTNVSGGIGGQPNINGGAGGAGTGSGNGGTGGAVVLGGGAGGAGGASGTNGTGGGVNITTGLAGTGGTTLAPPGSVTIQQATNLSTTSAAALSITETTNNAGLTNNLITADLTDTASAGGSNFLNLRKGGTTQFGVDKFGNITLGATNGGAETISTNFQGGTFTINGINASANQSGTNFAITAPSYSGTTASKTAGDLTFTSGSLTGGGGVPASDTAGNIKLNLGTVTGSGVLGTIQMGASGQLAVTSAGQISKYNNIATVGGGVPAEQYNTAPAAGHATISATTMITGVAGKAYRFSSYLTQTALGTSCAGSSTMQVALVYQDPNAAAGQTVNLGLYTIVNNGTVGVVPWTSGPTDWTFISSANVIQFQVTYTAGGSCSPGPNFQITPILEAL
jgi:hypothetical protein